MNERQPELRASRLVQNLCQSHSAGLRCSEEPAHDAEDELASYSSLATCQMRRARGAEGRDVVVDEAQRRNHLFILRRREAAFEHCAQPTVGREVRACDGLDRPSITAFSFPVPDEFHNLILSAGVNI